MIKNYLKIAWRNLIKSKQQTLINLFGLTIGTVSCLGILLYVLSQTGYDSHHGEAASIYRIETDIYRDGKLDFDTAAASPPTAVAIKEDFPEVAEATRVVPTDIFFTNLLSNPDDNEAYYEPKCYLADPNFFEVFTYEFVEGGGPDVLMEPNAVVLSSTLAAKLFGRDQAQGKTLVWGTGENALTLKVTGVFDDAYAKTHLNPSYIVSMNSPGFGEFVRNFENYATNNFVYSYIQLKPGSSVESLEGKLSNFVEERASSDLAEAGMQRKELSLLNIQDIHLYSEGRKNQIDTISNINYLYFLLTLAFFIQLTACVNFVNLSTARASKRAKEIGVRKVVGAGKRALRRQFLGESLLLSLIAILLSLPLMILLLPFINELGQASIQLTDVFQWNIAAILLGLGVMTGLVAGVYPAMVLSSVRPVAALKSSSILQSGGGSLRKVLVVFQFVVAIGLVATVVIITEQFRYAQRKDLGFDKENLLAVRMGSEQAAGNFEALRNTLLEMPGVIDVASGNYTPSEAVLTDNGLYRPGGNPQSNTVVKRNGVSPGYFRTMKIPLLQGRDFREGDSTQIVVNEATLEAFDIPLTEAIGEKLLQNFGEQIMELEIVGVVEDYHFASLKDGIAPLFLFQEGYPNWLFVRTNTTAYDNLLLRLKEAWEAQLGGVPFDYSFVDKEVEKLYDEEKRLGRISGVFTILAVLISCLGLFGLVSFVAEQKRKEIGIRKVLGASINSVVSLMTKDFIKLVGIAFLIASPIAYLLMQRWLEGFTYRIDIQWWVFALAGGFALGTTFLTVGLQSYRSAMVNPVKSLRTE